MIGLRKNARADAPRTLQLSTVVGLCVLFVLGLIWALYGWITIGERSEAIGRAQGTLAGLASAYGEHASTLLQMGVDLPGDESHLSKAKSAQEGEIALREYRTALNIPGIGLSLRRVRSPVGNRFQSNEPDTSPDYGNSQGRVSATVERPRAGLIAVATMSEDQAVGEWRERAVTEGLACGVITFAAAAIGFLLIRQLRRR